MQKQAPQACNFIKKEALAQVFSCEFCETSKDTFSYRIPLVAASDSVGIAVLKKIARFLGKDL